MKIVRRITYEVPDTDPCAEAKLKIQLCGSLEPGVYPRLYVPITVEHLEGPQWTSDGQAVGRPHREREAQAAVAGRKV